MLDFELLRRNGQVIGVVLGDESFPAKNQLTEMMRVLLAGNYAVSEQPLIFTETGIVMQGETPFAPIKQLTIGIGRAVVGPYFQNAYWTILQFDLTNGERVIYSVRSLALFLALPTWLAERGFDFPIENEFSAFLDAADYRELENRLNEGGYEAQIKRLGYPEMLVLPYTI